MKIEQAEAQKKPVMLFENVTLSKKEYALASKLSPGTLVAYRSSFRFAKGCIFRIFSPGGADSFDMRVTGMYQQLDGKKYSVELEKLTKRQS